MELRVTSYAVDGRGGYQLARMSEDQASEMSEWMNVGQEWLESQTFHLRRKLLQRLVPNTHHGVGTLVGPGDCQEMGVAGLA